MSEFKRRRLFVDNGVQGTLIKRILIFWMSCMLFVTLPVAITQSLSNPSHFLTWHYFQAILGHWPILAALAVMLPLLLYDVMRFSNRFAGPVFRLRRVMGRFLDGEKVEPVRFRDGDFWQNLADKCNELMARVEAAEKRAAVAESRLAARGGLETEVDTDQEELSPCG